MTKLLALFALACGCACAQQSLSFSSTLTTTGATSAAWTTNGVNGAILPILNHTVAVVVTGTRTGCSVRLEGSLDNSNWFDLSGSQSCASTDAMFHVVGKLVPYVRANLLVFAGTSAAFTYRGAN